MAKALRIGSMMDTDRPLADVVAELKRYREAGLDHAFASQIFGPDALTLLAVAGSQVPGIGLGTGVVPVYPRHPMMLAQQALTVQMVTGNRLLLGIGLSHQVVVENMWGMSFERPAAYMREYLRALMPLLRGEAVHSDGERVTTHAFTPLDIANVEAPPVLVAALGCARDTPQPQENKMPSKFDFHSSDAEPVINTLSLTAAVPVEQMPPFLQERIKRTPAMLWTMLAD